jgi:hypothetical protein
MALIASLLGGPVGLVVGLIALTRRPPPVGADRRCAIGAVLLSSLWLVSVVASVVFS